METECRHKEYEKENLRQTKRWHEIAEMFDDLNDKVMNMSRGACEGEDWMSFLNTYKNLRCKLIKEQLISLNGSERAVGRTGIKNEKMKKKQVSGQKAKKVSCDLPTKTEKVQRVRK